MKTFTQLTSSFLLLSTYLSLVTCSPIAGDDDGKSRPPLPPTCGTCNPLSGENNCDVTTSCINTGTRFHCACRAGYKASGDNTDITKQFRLQIPNYQFLVFTPEDTVCDTLCDDPYSGVATLCSEVPIYKSCTI